MTEQQKFRVINQFEGFEIREFDSCVVADVSVNGDIDSASSQGFRPLFNYISKNQISMTAPVLEEELAAENWRISFVMPDGSQLSDLPHPVDSPVTLREVPAHLAAALIFRGRTTEKAILQAELRLNTLIKSHGFKVNGKVRIARFDPPWKPPLFRHNEVILPVE